MSEAPEISGLHIGATPDSRNDPAPPVNVRAGLFAPAPARFDIHTLDITEQFNKASAYLSEAQLVKDESFTLFESVGTLEIMDPKMDSGCKLFAGDTDPDSFDPLAYTEPSQIAAIVDQLLCHFMAWLGGYPLSQTVLTSLHLHKLLLYEKRPLDDIHFRNIDCTGTNTDDILVTKVLRSFCLAIIKCCDSAIKTVLSEHFYEEEDFATQTFNVDLLSGATFPQVKILMEEAQGLLPRLGDAESTAALDARFALVRALLHAFCCVDDHLFLSADSAIEVEDAWKVVAALLPPVSKTHNEADMTAMCEQAFSHRVQRYLASNTPPRPMVKISWSEAVEQLTVMCAEVTEGLHSAYELMPSPSPHAIELFTWSFSSRRPPPSPYSRSLIQQVLFEDDTAIEVSHTTLVETDIRNLLLAGHSLVGPDLRACEISTDPRFKLARAVEEYVKFTQPTFINVTRMICQNRCRVRRLMSQSIATWDHLQAVSEDHDSAVYALFREAGIPPALDAGSSEFYPLSAWAFYHKLRVMEWVLQLGFELEVYQPDELAGIMTMLSYFAKLRLEHLDNITLLLRTRRVDLLKDVKCARQFRELEDARRFVGVLANEAQITASLSNALAKVYSLCNELELVASPERPYSSDQLRYEMRFKHFLTIGTPRLLDHADLHAATHFEAGVGLDLVFDTIDMELKTARAAITKRKQTDSSTGQFRGCEEAWNKTTQTLLQCTIAAGLALTILKTGCRSVSATSFPVDVQRVKTALAVEIPVPEHCYHAWWPVPKMTRR